MKTKILFTLLFATLVTNAVAETISVTVKDSKTKESVEYATVELLNEKDSVIIGGITDAKGYINLPATVNSGKIRIQFLGYKTYEAPVTGKDLGTVFLEEDSKLLKEVVVTGQTRMVKIDRDVFTITDAQRAGTATSRELLGKLNGVRYDPYTQAVEVNGSTNVLILVDGIEKDQNLAKTLSPDRVGRVEVIKDPVGKYAADGYTAVINIITKKDFTGIDVNAYFNPMFNFSKYLSGSSFCQSNSGVNFIYTYKKINLYGTYNGNWDKLPYPMDYTRQYGDLMIKTSPLDYRHPNAKMNDVGNNVSVGGDYTIKPDNIIALELNYNGSMNKQIKQYDLTTYLNNVPTGESQSLSNSRGTNDAIQGTLTYLGKWSDKSNFTGDFRYRHSTPTNNSIFTQGAINSQSYNTQTEYFYRVNLDYNYRFNPKLSMEVAYGIIIDKYNLYQDNMTQTQNQVRNRPSAYLNYYPNNKWGVMVGAMVEFFNQTFAGLKQSQTGLLPFANIQYKPSDKFSVIAKYHATPNYPDINSMATFKTQLDTLTWWVGNPNLKMSNNQEASIEVNFLKYFTIAPFYVFDANSAQLYLRKDNNQYFQSFVNTKKKGYGTDAWFTIPLTKQLRWHLWMELYHSNYTYNSASNARTTFTGSTSLNYSIPKWDASANFEIAKYISDRATLQGSHAGGNDWINIMFQKNLFKKWLSLGLLYFTPIKLGNFITYDRMDLVQTAGYYSQTRGSLALLRNAVLLQINIHFNSGKQGNVKKSSLDNDNNARGKDILGL